MALHLPVQQILQRRTRNHSEVYHSEFEVVETFEGHRWVTDASVHATNGLLNVPTVFQANFLQRSHSQSPHITGQMWHNFEMFIKTSNENHVGCLYDSILCPLPVRHWSSIACAISTSMGHQYSRYQKCKCRLAILDSGR